MTHFLKGLMAGAAMMLPAAAMAAPQLDNVYSDHMVLQREAPIFLKGSAEPGERLTVTLGDASKKVRAAKDGRFEVSLPAMDATAEGLTLTVSGQDGEQVLEDVLIGDVWMCSGQSNMEFAVRSALNGGFERMGEDSGTMRLITVDHVIAPAPRDNLPGDVSWEVATPETLAGFSAVCYYAARKVRESVDVPLGLINSSWGGSQIEAWISADHLRKVDGFDADLDMMEAYAADEAAGMARFGAEWEAWWEGLQTGEPNPWEDAGDGWTSVPGEMRDWKQFDDPDLANHLGMVWFRNTATLSADQAAAEEVTLSLGGIDEVDSVWVNGEFIASSFGWGSPRNYTVPADVLREGENDIIVNVYNSWGAGGMTGPQDAMKLTLDDGEVSLSQGWDYRKVTAANAPPRTPWESVGGLTGMANQMIAPFAGQAMKAGLWYQGESDAGEPETYAPLLRALVADWRDKFGEDLPVVIVQLPNFGGLSTEAGESGWAGIREAERVVAVEDDLVGVAVTIDAGDRFDIHPPNKQVVGARVGDVVHALAYGGDASTSGHGPSMAQWRDGAVAVSWDALSPRAVGFDRPVSFQLCGEGGECYFADASLEGSTVTVEPEDGRPASVRYCWGDAPLCNLYTEDDVPVTPFELAVE